jgi:LPS export ABC transporter protein LptC
VTARTWLRALVALLLLAPGCTSQGSKEPAASSEEGRIPDQILEGFSMRITARGVLVSRFRAKQARIYNDEEWVEADTVVVDFYRSTGEHSSTLRADRGTLHTGTKDMDAYGHVVVVSEDGDRLETESLHWRQDADRITTDDPVTLFQEGRVIHGIGLESDPSLTDVTILRPTGEFGDVEVP